VFNAGPHGGFYLSHWKCGQDGTSRCVNAGTGKARDYGLRDTTTCSLGRKDGGRVDMGYHYPQ